MPLPRVTPWIAASIVALIVAGSVVPHLVDERQRVTHDPPGPPGLLEVRMNGVPLVIPRMRGFRIILESETFSSAREVDFDRLYDFGDSVTADGAEARYLSALFGRLARSPFDPFADLRAEYRDVDFTQGLLSLVSRKGEAPSEHRTLSRLPPRITEEDWRFRDRRHALFETEQALYEVICAEFIATLGTRMCHFRARHTAAALRIGSRFFVPELDATTLAQAVDVTYTAAGMLLEDTERARSP